MPPRIDLTGSSFGHLTVTGFSDVNHAKFARWHCACDCGKTIIAVGVELRRGNVVSCGCRLSHPSENPAYEHGLSDSSEWDIWEAAKQRCHNPKNKQYKYYGAIGIKVCDEWRDSFSAFLEHVGRRPSSDLSLDRINPWGNYEPGNVRWTTAVVQRHNRRDSRGV